ncbi:MAG: hypothetical protein CVU39_00260 [Chloroflexi bacterium HGW-Chloroflexi-10]|nr:MAG: hypothetical protein CVU39_00260 [Chloroflexi bacterium HGW-Chloroflexi-10]
METAGKNLISMLCIGGFSFVFIGMGMFMLWRLWQDWIKVKHSRSWKTAPGRIIFSGVDSQTDTDEEGNRHITHCARVIYQYQTAGMLYKSDHVFFNEGVRTSNYHKQEEIAARYPLDAPIKVLYNPENPLESVLERKVGALFTTILIALVFLGMGLFVLISSLSSSPPTIPFLSKLLGG